ncbi:hypothetical protein BKP64_10580 [Marinobacter salinus]|uniref:Uncharacterized protein n=1 Tax=Marinobacter salinus TaxID=1874317 RepID=A0A1D9GLQ9_9GAMM|nr:hypothetical protein [Marinobacter salinus]AOY88576.1 hypothetical protein BKP64_10580 [Marinobacter salinus]
MTLSSAIKRHPFAAISVAAVISLAPIYTLAGNDYDDRNRHDWAHSNMGKSYSMEEIRTLARANALKRYGPGATATIIANKDSDSYKIQLKDSRHNVVQETEVNVLGQLQQPSDAK